MHGDGLHPYTLPRPVVKTPIVAPPQTPLRQLMNDDPVTLSVDDSQEHAARVIAKYNLVAAPVVDDRNRLQGIVTVDDAIDIILPTAWKKRLPVHGKTTSIEHDGRTVFAGLQSPLEVGRYHSLVADPALPECLEQSAFAEGVVMAVRHRELPAEGVQFHPESILTERGRELLGNFLDRAR